MTKLLTVKETAAYLRTSLQQVRRMIREGDLFAVKVGREYRIPLSALAEFLEGYKLAHGSGKPPYTPGRLHESGVLAGPA